MDRARAAAVVAQMRGRATRAAADAAAQLREVHALDVALRAQVAADPPPLLPGLRLDARDIEALVEAEVAATLGIGSVAAGNLVDLARRLHDDLAGTLTALEAGRLDLTRVRVLADLTRELPGPVATLVQDAVLPGAGCAPWEGPSAVTWRRRIRRAVKRFRLQDQPGERESLAAQTRTWVQVDDRQPALSTFSIVGPTEDILWLDAAITDCATQWQDADTRGRPLTFGQRRVATIFDLVEQVVAGRDPANLLSTVPGSSPAGVRPGRERELGLVMHADTFFGDGPAADDPGEVRGIGAPAPIDADTARELAHGRVGSASTRVLLADRHGGLQRLLRVGHPPDGGLDPPEPGRRDPSKAGHGGRGAARPPEHGSVHLDRRDRRPRPRSLPHLHPTRLPPSFPRLRPRPRRTVATRTHVRHQPQPQEPTLPPLEDPATVAIDDARRWHHHLDQPGRPPDHPPAGTATRLRAGRGLRPHRTHRCTCCVAALRRPACRPSS